MSKEITTKISSKEFINLSFELLLPSKKRVSLLIMILIILNFIFFKLIHSENLNLLYKLLFNIVSLSQNIFLVLLAVLVTGYALFQAILTKNHIIVLSKTKENERSKFTKFNFYFFILGLCYTCIIFLNFLILSIISNEDLIKLFYIEYKKLIHINIFVLFINIYLFFIMLLILDIKSFLKNLYDNFKINAFLESIDKNSDN